MYDFCKFKALFENERASKIAIFEALHLPTYEVQKHYRISKLCVGDVVARLQTIPQFFVSPLSTQSFLSTLWARNLLLFPAALHGIVTCFETFLSLGIALDSTVESYRGGRGMKVNTGSEN